MTQDEFVRKHGPSGLNLRITLFWEKAPEFPIKKKLILWIEEWLLDWDFSRPISAEVIRFYGCGTVKDAFMRFLRESPEFPEKKRFLEEIEFILTDLSKFAEHELQVK